MVELACSYLDTAGVFDFFIEALTPSRVERLCRQPKGSQGTLIYYSQVPT